MARNVLRASRTRPACLRKVFSVGMVSVAGDGERLLDAMFIKSEVGWMGIGSNKLDQTYLYT